MLSTLLIAGIASAQLLNPNRPGGLLSPAGIFGAGTANIVPMFSAVTTIADSIIASVSNYVGIATSTPNSTLQVYGSISTRIRTLATSSILTDTDHFIIVAVDASTTLPYASTTIGREYIIKRTGVEAVTVLPTGADTIDGAASSTLVNQYDSVKVVSDGTAWYKF